MLLYTHAACRVCAQAHVSSNTFETYSIALFGLGVCCYLVFGLTMSPWLTFLHKGLKQGLGRQLSGQHACHTGQGPGNCY